MVRLLPNMQRKVVDRCRTRSDAEGHLQVLRRLIPDAQLLIVFDCDVDETRSQHLAISKAT